MRLATVFFATAAIVLAQDTVSATGAACEPHGDHWHCPSGVSEPTTPPTPEATGAQTSASPSATESTAVSTTQSDEAAATACEPHGDHWHCPSGIPEPTTPPAATATGADHDHEEEHDHDHDHDEEHDDDHDHAVTATTCEPHNDHWHCPSGVAEPTTPPAVSTTTTSSSGTAAAVSNEPSPSQSGGAGVRAAGPMDNLPMAAFGLLGLLIA